MPKTPADPAEAAKPTARWGQERRLEFIDFRLRWEGRLNRADLMSFFGISVPQASLDIARYLELAPRNLIYDRRSRVYTATEEFEPLFPGTNPSRLLNELLAVEAGILAREASFVGWRPETALVPVPGRTLDARTLAALLRAIRETTGVRVLYQSMSKPEPEWRTLSPHAIANDGFRWHVRAYCHTRSDFRDFVIARMLKLEPATVHGANAEDDIVWNTKIELVLAPNPKLPKAVQAAVALDYGMHNDSVTLHCRQALLFYMLRHLGLDSDREGRPEATHLVLKNRRALQSYLEPKLAAAA